MDKKSQRLISEVSRLHSEDDTTNFIFSDFIYRYGSPLEAMLYAKLFWPDFAQVDEMIILSDVIEDESDANRVRRALQEWEGNCEVTERVFNRRYVPCDLFGDRADEASDETDEQLAETLVEMWNARLKQTFPDLHFSVTLERDPCGEVSVTFYRKRSCTAPDLLDT